MGIDVMGTEGIALREQWRKKIIESCYVLVAVIFVTEVITYILLKFFWEVQQDDFSYCAVYIAFPSLINFLCVLAADHVVAGHSPEKNKNIAVIGALFGICMVVASFHGMFLLTAGIFVVPIVASVMFDDLMLTRLTSLVAVALMLLSFFTGALFDHTWTLQQRLLNGIVGLVFIVAVYLICKSLICFSQQKNALIQNGDEMNNELRLTLRTDPMTGLYNHSEFYRQLEEGKIQCQKKWQNMTVVVLDADFFKKVNDNYGHENGDVVLIRIASVLREICSGEGHISRYGGEEFAVIYQSKNAHDVFEIMEQVRKKINDSTFDFMPGQHVGVSCGIYEYRGEDIEVQEIFNRADSAMYRAKKDGRNRCICYEE